MRGIDVIQQLTTKLPRQTTSFSENFVLSQVTSTGLLATATTTANHGLLVGSFVNVMNVPVPVVIDTVTDNGDNTLSIVTLTAHDLTKNPRETITVEARITGTSFDETYEVIGVDNRLTFLVQKESAQAVPSSGFSLQEQFISGYNGLKQLTAVTDDTFTYALTESLPDATDLTDSTFASTVSARFRVSGAVTFAIAEKAYTAQKNKEDLWLFVVVENTSPNKDRRGTNDASASRGTQQNFQQETIEGFTIYLFSPNKGLVKQDAGGLIARDVALSQRRAILQSILTIQFDPDFGCPGQLGTTYDGDGFIKYDSAYYVHAFQFQQVVNITNADTAFEVDDRAFRDIDFSIEGLGVGADDEDITPITGDVDLDDIPIEPIDPLTLSETFAYWNANVANSLFTDTGANTEVTTAGDDVKAWRELTGNVADATQALNNPTYGLDGAIKYVDFAQQSLVVAGSSALFNFMHNGTGGEFMAVVSVRQLSDIIHVLAENAAFTVDVGFIFHIEVASLGSEHAEFAVVNGNSNEFPSDLFSADGSITANEPVVVQFSYEESGAPKNIMEIDNVDAIADDDSTGDSGSSADATHDMEFGEAFDNSDFLDGRLYSIVFFNERLDASTRASVARFLAISAGFDIS